MKVLPLFVVVWIGISHLCTAAGLPDCWLIASVPDQELLLVKQGVPIKRYPISTSKFGLGDTHGSYRTPLGMLQVAAKIGRGAPAGAVFKSRRFTGEILRPNSPGRDPIVTRILWLRGLEDRNRNAHSRAIYIHGTPVERLIGRPASYGCIRMRSRDIIDLFERVPVGTPIQISNRPASRAARQFLADIRRGGSQS